MRLYLPRGPRGPRRVPARACGVAVLVLLLLISAGCQVTRNAVGPDPGATNGSAAPLDATFQSAVVQVTRRVRPAVVQITNEQTQTFQLGQPDTVPAGVGSGIIYDSQGHILTNNHVIAGAEKLLVSLPDGRAFPGSVVGADPQTDLAVVQISGDNLPTAALGSSDQLQVGDWVVAIGNALALPGGPTVTAGVVSALNRTVQEPGTAGSGTGLTVGPYLFDVIQTDAAINPGNSGGPLVNLQGQVIGINTMVAGQAEPGLQAEGIGFAIAISTVKPIADELVATGHAAHPYLGISYQPLNPAIAAQLGTSARSGAVIVQVVPGSPAETAGMQLHDVITGIDGQPLDTESALAEILNRHRPGDTIELTVLRGNQTVTLQVTLGQTPSAP